MNRETYNGQYKGRSITVKSHDGLRNALFIDGVFTGDAGFFSASAAMSYGMKLIDETR